MADLKNVVGNLTKEPTLKPRDDAFTQKMNEYHTKRKALLDAKPSKYLEPEWDDLTREMQEFRGGYEKPQLYSLREYLLDSDPDEFQIDEVRDDIDFKGIWDLMQKGGDFYKDASTTGKGFDSAVREKLFSGMADSLGVDYDTIYNQWLYGNKKPKTQGNPYYDVDNGNPYVDSNKRAQQSAENYYNKLAQKWQQKSIFKNMSIPDIISIIKEVEDLH